MYNFGGEKKKINIEIFQDKQLSSAHEKHMALLTLLPA